MSKIFYFTSTGNGLYVSKRIKEEIEIDLISMTKWKGEEVEDDFIGFVFPLHCFSIPPVAEEFIRRLKIKGNPYIFCVQVTGGGSSNNGFKTVNNILKEKGLEISNYEEFKYISNYTRAGKNPTEERAKAAIDKESKKLADFIKTLENRDIKKFKKHGNIITNLTHKMWREKYMNKDRAFNVNNDCISCSMCKKICPVHNIRMEDGHPVWEGNCVDCMGCINICPKKAINIGSITEKKNRYRNPYINANELI